MHNLHCQLGLHAKDISKRLCPQPLKMSKMSFSVRRFSQCSWMHCLVLHGTSYEHYNAISWTQSDRLLALWPPSRQSKDPSTGNSHRFPKLWKQRNQHWWVGRWWCSGCWVGQRGVWWCPCLWTPCCKRSSSCTCPHSTWTWRIPWRKVARRGPVWRTPWRWQKSLVHKTCGIPDQTHMYLRIPFCSLFWPT